MAYFVVDFFVFILLAITINVEFVV